MLRRAAREWQIDLARLRRRLSDVLAFELRGRGSGHRSPGVSHTRRETVGLGAATTGKEVYPAARQLPFFKQKAYNLKRAVPAEVEGLRRGRSPVRRRCLAAARSQHAQSRGAASDRDSPAEGCIRLSASLTPSVLLRPRGAVEFSSSGSRGASPLCVKEAQHFHDMGSQNL